MRMFEQVPGAELDVGTRVLTVELARVVGTAVVGARVDELTAIVDEVAGILELREEDGCPPLAEHTSCV